MKVAIQLITSAVALTTLLGGVASAATSVAELPLKASVLAKPNVIWGMDDSGSMDSEVMLNTNDGAFWWDSTAGTGWNASGVIHFNSAGTASSQWRKMVYLFPNGTGSGLRTYADSTNDHFAIPPTRQFAFLRSSDYNPLYYNPAITYKDWSPGYVDGAINTFAPATATAAKSHPRLGSGTFDLTAARALTTTGDNTFMAMSGMLIPAGSKTCNHASGCGTWTDEASERTAGAGTFRLAMAYYPATYYMKVNPPSVPDCTIDTAGGSCVYAPDGTTKLRRYEVKSTVTTYPSGRTYAAEIQNFANWFQYHRKRKLMANAAIGEVLEPLTGMRMGLVKFNSRSTPTMYDLDTSSGSPSVANRLRITGAFYAVDGSGGTPTRETLNYIGDQYVNTASTIQYACQRNNAFIVTDGFAVTAAITPPTYSRATWGSGVPYETIFDQSLADIALSYYTINLRPTTMATGRVPKSDTDLNDNLHMNTYALTLGAKGTIWQDKTTPLPTTASAWPNPNTDRHPSSVDDLWHATINGRGKMYGASDSATTAEAIQAGLLDIQSQRGAQSGVAVSTVNLVRGDARAYFGTYNPSGWKGDVEARAINTATGAVGGTVTWSAATKLDARSWGTRIIATQSSTGAGAAFTAAAVGGTVNPSGTYGTTADIIDYLRGNRTLEGTTFRKRTSLLGAILNSEPVVDATAKVLYVSSGDGMLHAFDITAGADEGKELWGFVPRAVLPDLGPTTQRTYAFKTQLDGSPVLGTIDGGKKILVAGMGAAGRSFFALDVSSPRAADEAALVSKVMWEFPLSTDSATIAKVGQSVGKPVIVKSPSDGYVVLVTSGYNNSDGKGRLWMLNATTGAIIKEFTTTSSSGADTGLAHVAAFDDGYGTARYVYGGDLEGSLWRFDLQAKDTPVKVAALTGPTGVAQPVTAQPELMKIDTYRVIVVGTGRLLDIGDFGSSAVQTLYAIKDGATISPARTSLVRQVYSRSPDGITASPVDWATGRGWYMDLPAGEQANTRPSIAYGGVAIVTNVAGSTDCTASSYLYLVNVRTGDKFPDADFVGAVISSTANATPVTVVVTTDGKARGLVQTYDGGTPGARSWPPPKVNPSKTAWREIRKQE
jgi:type IV pilus assembly protein PilY1